jgi:hypothetical protein
MKKQLSLALICWILLTGVSGALVLDPTALGMGARSVGLGRCAVAMDPDPGSVFVNPANATQMKTWGVSSMAVNLSEDINYTQLGFDVPQQFGTLGLSYLGAVSGGIIATTIEAGRIKPSGFTFDYTSAVLSLIYGKEINPDLSLGATLKYFSKSFSGVASGTGMDLDLGLLWKPNPAIKVGLSQQNTLPSPLGSMKWSTGNTEGIPFNTKLGVAYRPLKELMMTTDMDYSQNRPLLLHGGVEWGPLFQLLTLRLGIDQYAQNKNSAVTNLTCGLGLNVAGIGFDYAYYNDTLLPSNIAHYFSFRYQPPTAAEIKIISREAEKKEEPKLALKSFPDVPEGFFAYEEIGLLATANILGGYPDGTFRPRNTLTRAELCKVLVLLKGAKVEEYPYRELFKDVPRKSWAAPYIMAAVAEGWVKGYPDKTFKPNKTLNRAEAITTLAKFDGLALPEFVSRKVYIDLPLKHWATGSVFAAKEAGWLNYITGAQFGAGAGFTRAEAAYLMARTKSGIEKISALKKPSR